VVHFFKINLLRGRVLNFNLYIVIVIAFLFCLLIRFHYKRRLNNVIQSFLNAHENIMVLVNSHDISMINDAGLKAFGYETLESFRLSHADISDFFLNIDSTLKQSSQDKGAEYIDKYSYGKKWVELLSKKGKKQVRVKIFSKEEKLDRYYQIRISKLDSGDTYSLTFTDITELEVNRIRVIHDSEFDPLTKIYNRVKINELLSELTFGVKKHNHNLSLILFDIDHFKRVNDTYGHNAGDSVLRELSSLVKGLLRKGDVFARWGGEEFVIVLENTPKEKGAQLATRLQKEIERYPFNIVKKVTCSFGVTQFKDGDTENSFFERVDNALYEAKENGRNQVVTK